MILITNLSWGLILLSLCRHQTRLVLLKSISISRLPSMLYRPSMLGWHESLDLYVALLAIGMVPVDVSERRLVDHGRHLSLGAIR